MRGCRPLVEHVYVLILGPNISSSQQSEVTVFSVVEVILNTSFVQDRGMCTAALQESFLAKTCLRSAIGPAVYASYPGIRNLGFGLGWVSEYKLLYWLYQVAALLIHKIVFLDTIISIIRGILC